MMLGKVTHAVTATVKAERLTGVAFLVFDMVDGAGKVLASGFVAADTVGAGPGDTVLVTQGSAARMTPALSAAPVDLSIVAILDPVAT